MPLRALLDGEDVMPPFSAEQWEFLRTVADRLTLPCCGGRAIPRVSRCGLRHFYHYTRDTDCDWKPESIEHLYAKAIIADACREADFAAVTEYRGDGWIADVLAIRENIKAAFEVQWTRQSYVETVFRQSNLYRSGVRAWWFFKRAPKEDEILLSEPDFSAFPDGSTFKHVPFSPLLCNDMKFFTVVNDKTYPLAEFICMLLNQQVRYRATLSCDSYRAQMGIYQRACWNCRQPMKMCAIQKVVARGRCGVQLTADSSSLLRRVPFSHAPVIRAFVETSVGRTYNIRFVPAQTPQQSSVFACAACGYNGQNVWTPGTVLVDSAEVELPKIECAHEHWCISTSKEFCSTSMSSGILSAEYLK